MNNKLTILIFFLAVHSATANGDLGLTASRESVPGLYLDSHSDRCFQKEFTLQSGKVNIVFDYKVISKTYIEKSSVIVTINGNPIHKVLPCDTGKTIKLEGTLNAGTYALGFCTLGS